MKIWGFPSSSAVKNLPANQELQNMWVRSLGQEDPLEKGIATHSSIPSWRIPGTEEPGGLWSIGPCDFWHPYRFFSNVTCIIPMAVGEILKEGFK